jgi:hypothetical protein
LIKELISNDVDVRVRVSKAILRNREAEMQLSAMHQAGLVLFNFNGRCVQLLSEASRDELKSRYFDELRELSEAQAVL